MRQNRKKKEGTQWREGEKEGRRERGRKKEGRNSVRIFSFPFTINVPH